MVLSYGCIIMLMPLSIWVLRRSAGAEREGLGGKGGLCYREVCMLGRRIVLGTFWEDHLRWLALDSEVTMEDGGESISP